MPRRAVLATAGGLLILSATNETDLNNGAIKGASGLVLFGGGLITGSIGISRCIKGSKRKKAIEIEYVKFNPKGSASINGIGPPPSRRAVEKVLPVSSCKLCSLRV